MKRIDDSVIIEKGINQAAKEQADKAEAFLYSDTWDLRTIEMYVEGYRQASYEDKKDKKINLMRLRGINVPVDMVYEKGERSKSILLMLNLLSKIKISP